MNTSSTHTSALFPTYARFPIQLVKGEGSTLWDKEGNSYIDFMSGIAVASLGHAPEPVKTRLKNQLDELWHVSNLFEIEQQEALGRLLIENSGADAAFFCNSGAEANEAAIKLARRHHQQTLKTGRYEVITFHQSFHGRTLATLTATGQEKVKEGFAPLPDGFISVPYNDLDAVKEAVSEKTCAIMLEMVQGEGGIVPADPDFVQGLHHLCQEHGILLIVDEIQTGVGRTGKLFAHQHYHIEPDLFTLAKGLGSGFPIGAMLGKEALRESFGAGSHGTTFGGNPLACTAGLATLETILNDGWVEHAAKVGDYMIQELQKRIGGLSYVDSVRGKGLLIGISCTVKVAPIIEQLQKSGLLVISAGTQVLRIVPPLNIEMNVVEEGLHLLCDVMGKKEKEMSS